MQDDLPICLPFLVDSLFVSFDAFRSERYSTDPVCLERRTANEASIEMPAVAIPSFSFPCLRLATVSGLARSSFHDIRRLLDFRLSNRVVQRQRRCWIARNRNGIRGSVDGLYGGKSATEKAARANTKKRIERLT